MSKIYCYYFPNWHVDTRNEKWHGTGWTEWQVVKYATPRFEGHLQPKVPLWGYEDESDPEVMVKKIDTASSYGIDGFIFDWYWPDGGMYREKCLEEGFLKAPNCDKLEFGIMLCNHDASLAHPISRSLKSVIGESCVITPERFKELTDYCIENYFPRKNYMRVDGKIMFSVFNISKFVADMGDLETAAKAVADFRQRVRDADLGEVHFSAMDGSAMFLADYNGAEDIHGKVNEVARTLTLDSWCTHLNGGMREIGTFPAVDYGDWIEYWPGYYKQKSKRYDIPYNPCVSSGWDSSPRTVQSEIYENVGYPYCAVAVNNTSQNFEKALRNAKTFMQSEESTGKFITISSWNEWTEGSYLEPDEENGYGFLEAVKRVFAD